MKKYSLEIIAFIGGAVIMIIELVGSRIVAPYLGTSIFVWTSLIGVIMASLSLGYYFGGTIADKRPYPHILSYILLLASVCSTIIIIFEPLLILISRLPFDIRIITTLASSILFLPVTFFLGMVSPYVVRLKMTAVDASGSTVGKLYALSTIGSIVGTFLGGFFLISILGTKTIFIIMTGVLFLLYVFSLTLNKDSQKHNTPLIGLFVILFILEFVLLKAPSDALADIDTPYNRWYIYDSKEAHSGRTIRLLTNTKDGVQSGMYTDSPTELLINYLKYFDLAYGMSSSLTNALLIGAGAYTYPLHFIDTFPKAHIDVVEIDSKLDDIAKRYFQFTDDPRITVIENDGRIVLNSSTKKYDVIFLDAFSSQLSIPFHLTTQEAVEKMYASLSPDGLVMMNIISTVTGTASSFVQTEFNTYKEIFPSVEIIQVDLSQPYENVQNLILIAHKNPQMLEGKLLATVTEEIANNSQGILTDNFAPVEKFAEELRTKL